MTSEAKFALVLCVALFALAYGFYKMNQWK